MVREGRRRTPFPPTERAAEGGAAPAAPEATAPLQPLAELDAARFAVPVNLIEGQPDGADHAPSWRVCEPDAAAVDAFAASDAAEMPHADEVALMLQVRRASGPE